MNLWSSGWIVLRQGWFQWGTAIASAGLSWGAIALPAHSATEIIITYGFFERTVTIEDLEAFAAGKGLSRQLTQYAEGLNLSEADIATIQQVLNRQAELSAVDVAQFLYTPQGEALLDLVGEVIQTPSRKPGFHAIRSSLILSAADEDTGLTVLNFLKRYPTPEIRVDVRLGVEIAQAVTRTIAEAEKAFELVQALAKEAAATPIDNLLQAQQLVRATPPFQVVAETLKLPTRRTNATLYLPRSFSPPLPNNIPVIVISHGLGDSRASYEYLGNYLAQRGFAVAAIDHPGSNANQIAQLLSGLSPDLINNEEFLDRPEDVTVLIDTIQQFAEATPRYQGRLNTENVGVVGHSFGGYTALALAGAPLNSSALDTACQPQPIRLNLSLLLQCQATAVATSPVVLQDDRVKAILAVNPVGSALFGESGFQAVAIPVMLVGGTADTIAPALPEQIRPFTWLQAPDRYLVLISRLTHFSVIPPTEGEAAIPVPPAIIGDGTELAQEYVELLSHAFFARYLLQDERYSAVLSASFLTQYISEEPLAPISVIRELSADDLQAVIAGWEETPAAIAQYPPAPRD
jgi:predicted dienelactone hydrolase